MPKQSPKQTLLPTNTIIQGDCIEILNTLPINSIDLIFADPPYNLQLENELLRPNQTIVDGVNDNWDKFDDLESYDLFTKQWLEGCRRVLKDTGTIWVIGSYHNIYRVGRIMMDMGYWILNDVVWHKTNPMPNFRGTRFTNATETMIWAKRSQTQKTYTFNYKSMKNMNDDKQMPNVWSIPICSGSERIKINGKKAHSTQKPEALLYRVILSSSNPKDVVLDPFFGSGTTGAVAKKLDRYFIGIEKEDLYIDIARQRIDAIQPVDNPEILITPTKRNLPRVSFATLVENGYINVGTTLYSKEKKYKAIVHADGTLVTEGFTGSIHKVGAFVSSQAACNGWDFWYFEDKKGNLLSIDVLREQYRTKNKESANE